MIGWTGHPLADVGLAAITAFARRTSPGDLTTDDLEEAAAYLQEQYQRPYLSGFIVCVFPNSAYVNPTAGADKKQAFLDSHLFAFRASVSQSGGRCAFCAMPAHTRGFRQHVPMLTGEGILNFFPNGQPGLPLCGICMLAVAAVPLGALKCGGRALIVHSDDPTLTLRLAAEHVRRNQELFQLSGLAEGGKVPDSKNPGTRLMSRLTEWAKAEARARHRAPVSLTAYHFSNSGQGPDIAIYPVPAPHLGFLVDTQADHFRAAWTRIVAAAWRKEKGDVDEHIRRNFLFEDFLRLPAGWPRFVRTYFLRRAARGVRGADADPRAGYSFAHDIALVNWELTALFLRSIAGMDAHRVAAIRDFGDRIAEYIINQDPRFWERIHMARLYKHLRVRIINASCSEVKAGRQPLLDFDGFLTIFEVVDEVAHRDWQLARDLVLIRVIERLHAAEWFKKNPEQLAAEMPEEVDDSDR